MFDMVDGGWLKFEVGRCGREMSFVVSTIDLADTKHSDTFSNSNVRLHTFRLHIFKSTNSYV
jgi:hypothetical protein